MTKYTDSGDGYTRHRTTGYDPTQTLCPFGVFFALVCQRLVLGDAKHKDSLGLKSNKLMQEEIKVSTSIFSGLMVSV